MRWIVVLTVLLAGCSTQAAIQREMRGMEGQPQAFRDGYAQGCSSGKRAGGESDFAFQKDVNRYESDRLYRQGWQDGYDGCKGRLQHDLAIYQMIRR